MGDIQKANAEAVGRMTGAEPVGCAA